MLQSYPQVIHKKIKFYLLTADLRDVTLCCVALADAGSQQRKPT